VAAPEVTIQANLEGAEQVTAGFNQMSEAAGNMGSKVSASSNQMEISHRRLALTMAGMISNSVQLGDIMHRMASGQMDIARGALLLTMNFIQLATQIALVTTAEHGRLAATIASMATDVAHTIALKAKAAALIIAHALSGPAGWAILAGAAAAATIGFGLLARGESAGVYTKASPLKFITGPLAGTTVHEGASIIININGAGSPQQTGDAVVDALRRAGVVT